MKTLLYLSLIGLLLGVGACKKENTNETSSPPIDSFIGRYHMVGGSQTFHNGDTTHYPITLIDDTMIVTKIGSNTLHAYSEDLDFTTTYSVDSINFYNYWLWFGSAPSHVSLSFHKPFTDDSAFYYYYTGGLGGGTATTKHGIKIH